VGEARAGDRRAVVSALEEALGRRPSKRLAGMVAGCIGALSAVAGSESTFTIEIVDRRTGSCVRAVVHCDRPVGDEALTLARTVASSVDARLGPDGPEVELLFDDLDDLDPLRPSVAMETAVESDLRAVLARQTAQLRDLAAELGGANARLQRFARLLGHDLKNPLSTISFATELLPRAQPGLTDDARQLTADIATATREAVAMINDILAYSQAGDLLTVPVDLDTLVTEVVESVRPRLERSEGAVEVAGPLPVVEANPTALRHVLTNLLTNALAYRHPGRPPHVTITVEPVPGHWRVVVADNGVGVPEDQREAIFDAGVRLNEGVPGTGYGLAAVRTLVERHGGRIGTAPNPTGEGVRFLVDLPRATGDELQPS
jgi:signal transduction histidine kinase